VTTTPPSDFPSGSTHPIVSPEHALRAGMRVRLVVEPPVSLDGA
jgi:hypothetical protein